ncbi:ComEA family DNA-binding protein [Streptomyces actuosus]|uniref:ComEA family DNA-binding protein n=1 Tax=Streptomyces actuosus TaxID=1885 RepID=A0ABS2VT22_STRAS|nr:ComEA family DNA-binding protein [Streptomyces actuosus]MBN0046271.1 ComEA family DNA-binding protein [Streptomyces actuosus]
MALRSRSHTATSGPGREPGSDRRVHHRRPRGRGHTRQRRAPAEDLKRRAEALLLTPHSKEERRHAGEEHQRARPGDESGAGPPPGGPRTAGTGDPGPPAPADPDAGTDAAVAAAPAGAAWWARAGMALRERMPVWVQTRCGLERRSVIALAVLLVVAVAFAAQHFWGGRTRPVRAPEVVRAAAPHGMERTGDASAPAGTAAGTGPEPAFGSGGGAARPGGADSGAPGAAPGAEIVVDVGGKVRRPGIHRLPAGSRVADALDAAGGARPGTDLTGLNRARFLADGEQVIVGATAPVTVTGAGTAPGGPMAPGAVPVAPVSLNTATLDQLDTLPGVGPVLARHIVDYRTRHGGFRSVDELREVNGIGERRFADLRNLVRP